MGFTQEQIELIDRAAAAAAENLAQQAVEEAQYWSGLEAKLRELHAPAILRLLNDEIARLVPEAGSRPSRITETINIVRGEVNGFVNGLALALGVERKNLGTFWSLIAGLSEQIDHRTAYSEVRDNRLNVPSSLGL